MDPVRPSSDNDTLVGSEKWGYIKVVDILMASSATKSLLDKMFTLARRLQIPVGAQKAMERRIFTNTATYEDVLYEILEAWRGSKAGNASIFVLVRQLEKCGLHDCATSLREKMLPNERAQSFLLLSGDDIEDRHSWNDLSEEFQVEIKDKNIIFQGKHIKIGKFTQNVHNLMDGKFLRQLIKGELPTTVNSQVPQNLKYYIQRKVENRSILKQNIFKDSGEHVLVVQGLERHELTSLTNSPTDVSGNQIQNLTVRFILLELDEDFEKIVKMSKIPVHCIRFQNGVYKWIKSSGSVAMLQNYIDKDNQDKCDEKELASTKHKVVVISDSPGMGKTHLLVNIAHAIMNQDNTLLVLFIVLQEFAPKLSGKVVDTETVISLIAEMHSECEFGRKFISHVLKSEPCILLFDGYDEVLLCQISTANEALQVLKSFEKVQIYVTTRPHMRDELERTLDALGYTINPFSTSNQINFLINYWESTGIAKHKSVHRFAATVLDTLTSNMTDSERDIAGIPLQCRMLAETYTDDAERCSKLGFENYSDSSQIVTSVFKMYERHMNMRFGKICKDETILKRLFLFMMSKNTQYDTIKHAHIFYALKLLFPEQAGQFQKQLCTSVTVPLHELCGLGILEATHQNDIRFVHRTFAEYLVAWFVTDVEVNECSKRFILAEILKTRGKQERFQLTTSMFDILDKWVDVESHEFIFPVICYFINGLTGKSDEDVGNLPEQPPIPSLNYNMELLPVYFASARQNYIYIPIFASNLSRNENVSKCNGKMMADLVFIAAYYSGVNLLKLFSDNEDLFTLQFPSVEYPYPSSQYIVFTPLHVAVRRGHYNLVAYLITRYGKQLKNLTHLIHVCLAKSSNDDPTTLLEKKQIIKLLLRQSKQWLEEPYHFNDSATPLLKDECSMKLRKCLMLEGANVNAFNNCGEVVLHKIFDYSTKRNHMAPELYHQFLVSLIERGFKFFDKHDICSRTPLFVAIQNIEILPDTVRLFFTNGANFNHCMRIVEQNRILKSESLLFIAISNGRSTKLIDLLIDCGSNCKYVNQKGKTVLHFSAEYGNAETLEYFLTNHEIDVNCKDKDDATALHYAVQWRTECMERMQQLLIKAGTDLSAQNSDMRTPFMEAFATANGLTLRTIHLMEKHGLNITKQIASEALNYCGKRLDLSVTAITNFGNEIQYLWGKSGGADSDFSWELLGK